jgi:hypothetical protein
MMPPTIPPIVPPEILDPELGTLLAKLTGRDGAEEVVDVKDVITDDECDIDDVVRVVECELVVL